MPLKKLPYESLSPLVAKHLSTEEEPKTDRLIRNLAGAHVRGYLTKTELLQICRWKSARAIKQIRRNSADSIKRVTRKAFKTRSERTKLECLRGLHGVEIPMASAILMLTNPKRYGVIDIRVWQLLYEVGAVTKNKRGTGFRFNHWYRFLVLLRYYAKRHNVRARDIERTLFDVHSLYQSGNLYDK